MKKLIKIVLNLVPKWIKNRYFISAIIFLIWISFFDANSFFTQIKKKKKLNKFEIFTIVYSINQGLCHLNLNSIIHRDLHAEKVMTNVRKIE